MTTIIHYKQWVLFAVLLLVLSLSNRLLIPVHATEFDCEAGVHNYTVDTIEPTQDNDGLNTFLCSICGYTYSQTLLATGHVWSEWIIDKETDCTEDGHRYRICTRFGHDSHLQEEDMPALGHDYAEEVISATCEENGKTIYTCERCEDTYEESGENAIGHHYTEKVLTPPECETDGEKEYTCEHCSDVFTEAIPAFGHDYGEWITVREAAVEEPGWKHRICRNDSSHIIEQTIEPLLPEPEPHMDWVSYMIISIGSVPFTLVGFSVFRDCQVLSWKKRSIRLRLKKISKGGMS